MYKNLITTFSLLICIGFQTTAQTIARKFQKIPTEGIEALIEVAKPATATANCTILLEENTLNSHNILVEIEASGRDIPRRILDGLMDAGEFDLDFSIVEEALVVKNRSEMYIRIKNQTYTIKLKYKIFVPKRMAGLFGLPTELGIAANN